MPIDPISATIAIFAFVGGQVVIAFISEWRARREAGRRRDEQEEGRQFEREQAAEARLFERRADAYVELVTGLSRTQDKIRNALPVMGWHKNPFEMTEEQRREFADEARRLDALVVAFGSAELREMLHKLRPLETRFFINAERYEREGGNEGPDKFERYEKAHEIREEYQALLTQIRDRVGAELGAIPAPPAA